ncbi:MAG: hypothetical protein HY873_08165 [Chloroflexi bacterium]|nr:hypothetical protein [Chloroflexota bacterium]
MATLFVVGARDMRSASAAPLQCFDGETTLAVDASGGATSISLVSAPSWCFPPGGGTLTINGDTYTYTVIAANVASGLVPALPTGYAAGALVRGPLNIEVLQCLGGAPPTGPVNPTGPFLCGISSSETSAPVDTVVAAYDLTILPAGNRYSSLPLTFTPSGAGEWQEVVPACGGVSAFNECLGGSIAGDYTMVVDSFCTVGADDVFSAPGSNGGDPALEWPKVDPDGLGPMTGWNSHMLVRTAASASRGGGGLPVGGDNVYVPEVAPQPLLAPDPFTFASLDTVILVQIFLGGTAPFPLPEPIRLQQAAYESPYKPGLLVAATILGDDPNPGTDELLCFDPNSTLSGPQHSLLTRTVIKTPATPGLYPRWMLLTSNPDMGDASVGRFLDATCTNVGAFAGADSDNDCLPDADEPMLACILDSDCDNDLLPDGVEKFNRSCIINADVDLDGATDFDEMYSFTRPGNGPDGCTASTACSVRYPTLDIDPVTPGVQSSPFTDTNDTDCDGSKDPQDTGAGFPADATDDDNCPSVFNPQQENEDAKPEYHGAGPGTGDNTNPDQDWKGDACDMDMDNDGLLNFQEARLRIIPWTGFNGVCSFSSVGVLTPLDPLDGDTDNDLILDGAECRLGSRPDMALTAVATCVRVPVIDPDGCAQPRLTATNDADGDGLFRFSSFDHPQVENFFRTQSVCCLPGGGLIMDIDGDGLIGVADKDSDRDTLGLAMTGVVLQDGVEVKFYGTRPGAIDTDGDGCLDAEEVLDTSGDRKVTAGDQLGFIIRKNMAPAFGKLDPDNDGDIDNPDLINYDANKNRSLDAGDQLMMAAVIAAPGACPTSQQASKVLNGSVW